MTTLWQGRDSSHEKSEQALILLSSHGRYGYNMGIWALGYFRLHVQYSPRFRLSVTGITAPPFSHGYAGNNRPRPTLKLPFYQVRDILCLPLQQKLAAYFLMSLILFLADWNVEKMIAEIHFGAPTLSARISPAEADGRSADGKTSAFPPDLVSLIKSTALKKSVSECGGREGENWWLEAAWQQILNVVCYRDSSGWNAEAASRTVRVRKWKGEIKSCWSARCLADGLSHSRSWSPQTS